MTDMTPSTFTLDGRRQSVAAEPGETDLAGGPARGHRRSRTSATAPAPGYRADGNCRACMVEIEGERVLAASCIRKPAAGMEVKTDIDRAVKARRDGARAAAGRSAAARCRATTPTRSSGSGPIAMGVDGAAGFPRAATGRRADRSHPAMAVQLDACIHCRLCVRACREVQVNDVIGMADRGARRTIVFDFDDPMGQSTCVACGECVQACPTGALLPASRDRRGGQAPHEPDRKVDSLCPYCGVGCQTHLPRRGRPDPPTSTAATGPANHNRLCVKGRFGFDYVHHPTG